MHKLLLTLMLYMLLAVGSMIQCPWSIVSTLKAQEVEAPDYKQIRAAISNQKGQNYYPTLMRRYLANDSTLTLEQVRNLYYGFALQEDFVPYQTQKKELYDIRRALTNSGGNPRHCPEAIRISQMVLDDNPFDLLAISTMSFAFLQLQDSISFHLWDEKQTSLLDAIVSSGDGETKETAFHVINIEHEYEVLNRLGLQIEKDSLCNESIEYLKVKENSEEIPGLFFNFGACRSVYKRRYEK